MGRPVRSSSPGSFRSTGGGPAALAAYCTLVLGLLAACAPAAIDGTARSREAAQILAPHPGTSEVLIAAYERVIAGSQPRRDSIVMALAEDYAYVEQGRQRTIVDAKLGQIISLDLASGSFRRDSIYSLAGLLESETKNRMWIRELLRRTGATEETAPFQMDPFWIESELGVPIPESPRPRTEARIAGGTISFSHAGSEVATVTFSEQQLAGARLDRLRNILRATTKLHPEILEQIVAAGRLPQTLEFRMLEMPTDAEAGTTTYRLQSARTESVAFPLPEDAGRHSAADHPFYADVLPVMEAAVAGTHGAGPRSSDWYFSRIGEAVERKAWFEALMLQTELSLLTADRTGGCTDALKAAGRCVALFDHTADLVRDERTSTYLLGQDIQNSEPVRAVEIWSSIPVVDLPNSYLMGVFIGNVVSVHRNAFDPAPVDPYAMFTAAIAANPYVSSFYKDLGDHFIREMEFGLAWICYDLGRALPNRPAGDVLEHVDQLEGRLRQRVPQLF